MILSWRPAAAFLTVALFHLAVASLVGWLFFQTHTFLFNETFFWIFPIGGYVLGSLAAVLAKFSYRVIWGLEFAAGGVGGLLKIGLSLLVVFDFVWALMFMFQIANATVSEGTVTVGHFLEVVITQAPLSHRFLNFGEVGSAGYLFLLLNVLAAVTMQLVNIRRSR